MNKIVKLIIAILFLTGAIYLFTQGFVGWGFLALLLAAAVAFFYFINENLLLAFLRMRKQDLPGAQKHLQKITNPTKQLFSKSVGYYHYMNGLTIAQDNLKESQKEMKAALKHGLPFGHDKAMAKLSLAGGAMQRGDKKEAVRLLKEAREDDKQGVVREQIDMMEQQMSKVQRTPTGQMGRSKAQVRGRSRYF